MERLLKVWIDIERKGLKEVGYKAYALGALVYSFYRLRLFHPVYNQAIRFVQQGIVALIH